MTRRPVALVVDDSATVRATLEAILVEAGFDVLTEIDAQGALDEARYLSPDVVLLDLRIPGARDRGTVRGGEEALRKLKSDPRTSRIPVFMISGESDRRSAETLIFLGAAGYFGKPFDPGALLAAIRAAIGS